MPTSEVMKAAKAAQVRESIERGGRSPDAQTNRDMNEAALDVVADHNQPVDEPAERGNIQREPSADPQPIQQERSKSIFEQRRAEIINRFREQRAVDSEDGDENTRDIRRLTRDGMPPELVPLAEDALPEEVAAAEQPQPEDTPPVEEPVAEVAPAKRKIKVRGKEIEVTEDELLAYAQKGAAGDDYLAEARKTLDEVKALQGQIRATGQAPTTGTHPASPQPTQTEVDAPAPAQGNEQHVDPFVQAMETMQLGTPEEAAPALRKTVEDTATKAARDALERERLRDEAARSARFLKTFSDENPELANDSLASAVIERKLYDLQVEDIKALGIDESKLPRTPTDIANWHLWYRSNGYKVRNIPELLTTARDEVYKWKGQPDPKAKPTEPAPRKAEPRVEVTVDRAQRRAAIPQQPSRTSTPAQVQRQAPAQPRDRSEVVQQMIANRARAKAGGSVRG